METLAIVEVLGRRGEVVHRERLHRLPAVIGRGFDADVILDDPHVAARHLQFDSTGEQGFNLIDLGSKNGFTVLGNPSSKGRQVEASVQTGATVRLGHTQLRIWHPMSSLAEEAPVRHAAGVLATIGCIAWLIATLGLTGLLSWVDATGPGGEGQVGKMVLFAASGLLIWSGFWWLVSRTSQRDDSFVAHATIAARMLFLLIVTQALISTAAFAFDFYPGWRYLVDDVFQWAVLSHGIFGHLRLLSRKPAWALLAQAAVMVALLMVPLEYTLLAMDQDKVGKLDLPSTLRPPWMRVVDGVTPEEFFK